MLTCNVMNVMVYDKLVVFRLEIRVRFYLAFDANLKINDNLVVTLFN